MAALKKRSFFGRLAASSGWGGVKMLAGEAGLRERRAAPADASGPVLAVGSVLLGGAGQRPSLPSGASAPRLNGLNISPRSQ
jgi:hypothetical protein